MLARQLLEGAIQEVEKASSVVGTTAYFHIARVLNTYSHEEARALLLHAIRELKNLSLPPHDLRLVQQEAQMLTAATAPELIESLPPLNESLMPNSTFWLFQTMLDHNHVDATFKRLMEFPSASEFPHMAVPMVLARCDDEERKLMLVRRSIQAWQDSLLIQPRLSQDGPHLGFAFLDTFIENWKFLPVDEAASVTHKLVSTVLSEEDFPMQAEVGPENRITFTSARQFLLFELLDPLRSLDPTLADSLMPDHPELAAAAAFFPFGMRSVHEAWQERSAGRCTPDNGGYFIMGSEKSMPFLHALVDGRATGQFEAAFEKALNTFHVDQESNSAVKECWPSTQALRSLFHTMGKSLGLAGAAYLERVPDPDLRLYGQIELAAALAGLPAYVGMQVSSPRPANR